MATPELAAKLARRHGPTDPDAEEEEAVDIDEVISSRKASLHVTSGSTEKSELESKFSGRRMSDTSDQAAAQRYRVFNPFTEFPEFSRKDIRTLQDNFKKYDNDRDNFIGFNDLKLMMEKLGIPQTHLALKQMIREVDEDHDDQISFREFLTIFRRAREGGLSHVSGLVDLYQKYMEMEEIEVTEVGVGEAKNFFESKIRKQSLSNQSEMEIRAEQEERKKEAEDRKLRKQAFKEKANFFQSQ